MSENFIVVGATHQDYDELGGSFVNEAGASYVFYKNQGGTNNWGLLKKIVNTGINGRKARDRFGSSVAVSNYNIVVGSFWQDFDANGNDSVLNAGRASIFEIDHSVTSVKETNHTNCANISSSKKTVLINFLQEGDHNIQVIDLLGRNLITKNVSVEVGSIEKISLEGIAQGYYVVSIIGSKQYQSSKVYIH